MATNLQPRPLHNSPSRSRCDNRNVKGRFYESPRIDAPDSALFPTAGEEQMLTSSDSLERWKYMAKLAGRHQQPHDRMHVNLQRVSCPQALEAGVPSSIGGNIQTLHLPLKDASQLPEWLDAISKIFPNLRHLHLTTEATTSTVTEQDRGDSVTNEQTASTASTAQNSNADNPNTTTVLSDETLVRRLYVLYRLPQLKSMDGQPFSEQEQKLSRPRERSNSSKQTPTAEEPTSSSTQDTKTSCLLDESSDEEGADVTTSMIAEDREVEIGLNGKPMPCDPDRWEYASVESSAVACEWGCGISSLPYFQRNKKKPKWKSKRTKKTTPSQTAMRLSQFTFEDSIEIDDKTASEVCRISTPPSETLLEHNESPISTSSSSHSKSQTSNQENVAIRRVPPVRSLTSPFPMQFRSARRVTERVDKLIGAISDDSSDFPLSDAVTMETIDHRSAIPLTRIQSSPSNLGAKVLLKRPPPCPGRRAPLGTRPQRTKRRQNRWRERLTARSNSIFDNDDDDDEEDDDHSENSDRNNSRVQLEPKGIRLT